ncbi:hypothetical protein A3D80_00355 [Candidatus Roizmanbacteria bacterium RIFCSPHIGHO2_02_FULL_40_13b]|nr:MAG: hypothetical protein A3D80_00355 [Candidatus Roizmanbacteria bacterium RIFCSPHIGHO2_02_FULL_40_13b]OGK49393.1 MAG: hypothetical protein A3A56_01850 [Candidatus Roizmanbacteria bacterium RIFCSPLOWO2_01_FULL_40_32]OGK56587.1 MAG: hypothetical protein A3H83_03385 [Candidatus Roizmanbacteria bacterium RIFCSPLOWO2_02_FULL_39_8]
MKSHFIREIGEMENTHWWHRTKRELISNIVRKQVGENEKKLKILEIGAGTGMLIKEFAHDSITFALDRNKSALALCKINGIEHIIRADFGTYEDYKKNYFDIIVAGDVLEHLENDMAAVRKVFSMLKKGGLFVIHVPADPKLFSYWDRALSHFRRYEKKELERLLKKNKFNISFISYRLSALHPFVSFFRKIKSNKNQTEESSDFDHLGIMNEPLYRFTKFEDTLILSKRIKPKTGLSLFAIAQKK